MAHFRGTLRGSRGQASRLAKLLQKGHTMLNLVNDVIAWENGELDEEAEALFFQGFGR